MPLLARNLKARRLIFKFLEQEAPIDNLVSTRAFMVFNKHLIDTIDTVVTDYSNECLYYIDFSLMAYEFREFQASDKDVANDIFTLWPDVRLRQG